MAKKKARPTNFKDCVCSKCGAQAHTAPTTNHRWCKGNKGARKKGPKPGTWV